MYIQKLLPYWTSVGGTTTATGQSHMYLPGLMALAACHSRGGALLLQRLIAVPHLPTLKCVCGRQLSTATKIGTWPAISCRTFSRVWVGFKEEQASLCFTAWKYPSTYEQLQVVDKYLQVPNVKWASKRHTR